MKIELGQECRDKVTGFKGIATARTEWLNGCTRVTIQPKMGKDGKCPDNATFDEPQLEVVGKGVTSGPDKIERQLRTGGPIPEPRQQRGPTR